MRLALAIVMAMTACISFAFAAPNIIVLKNKEALTANFNQERHLKGFNGPIISSGRFFMLSDKTVIWATKHPFESHLIVNDKGISQTIQGRETLNLPASKFPGIAMLQPVFEATLKGDWEQLESQFGTKPVFNGEKWSYSFELGKVGQISAIKIIKLSGKAYVETIEIQRTNGDRDMIYLSEHSVKNVSAITELKGYSR